jgi:hypothetical protein
METTLRTTPTPSPATTPRPRKRFDPTQLFAQRDRLPWFWFLVAMLVTALAAWDRQALVAHFKERERVVIIDPSQTFYVSPLLHFGEARELHVQQAELATLSLLQRNPRDFDFPDILKLMFLKDAFEKASLQRSKEDPEFRAKSLHQKPEIARVDILATREDSVLASVTGQLVRTGVFQDKAFTEGLQFTLKLNLVRNPNMAANGRFPTAVAEFKYDVSR